MACVLSPSKRSKLGLNQAAFSGGNAFGAISAPGTLVFADDPSLETRITEPGGDPGEIHLALAHDGKLRMAIPVLVMHVVDEVVILLHRLQRVHTAVDDVADIGGPADYFRLQPVQQHLVVFA